MTATLNAPVTSSARTMNAIQIYNTLTRKKEPFQTVQPGKVGIYLCGPTVYKEAHIGHMVGPVIFDTIKRFLTHCGYEVNWVVNITDVDDKLIAQARERGISMSQVATEMTMDYCANLLAMGVDQITAMPKATENMDEIIAFIADLLAKEYAYEADGDLFFDVGRDAHYGKLSNRSAESQQGEGGGAAAKKRSPGDFALWKSAKPGEPSWPSPWGSGRPGWHIECSAMSRRLLGKTFDIHGGGLDLMFPHHENEIAQSECCHGRPMARYWVHNGLLRAGDDAGKVGGRSDRAAAATPGSAGDAAMATARGTPQEVELAAAGKMSRSAGAGGLRGLIQRQGGERIRFFLLRTHYRSTIVFSEHGIAEAGGALDKFYQLFERYARITGRPSFYLQPHDERPVIKSREAGDRMVKALATREIAELRESFLAKMDDDFNTGAAVSDLFQILTALNRFADSQKLDDPQQRQPAEIASFELGVEVLRELAGILGLFLKPPAVTQGGGQDQLAEALMQIFIQWRAEARQNKDFALADKIRKSLTEVGVTLEDRKDGTGWSRG